MEGPLLRDETESPSDEVLARYLGKAKAAWDAFAARLGADFPDACLEWRFYKDGKAWLCKVVRKKKTVCWVSVWDQAFRTTFYFTSKNDQDIDRLAITKELKTAYQEQSSQSKLKPFTVEVSSKEALGDVYALFEYKSK